MARGRMLNVSICASLKFHNLSDDTARLIATWMISYLDFRGVFYADPAMVKSMVLPRRTDISIEKVEHTLDEMVAVGLIFRFQHNDDLWQCWPHFADNQVGLRPERERTDYPDPTASTAEPIRHDAGTTPEAIQQNVRRTEQNRTEQKGKEKEDAIASASTFPEWQQLLKVTTNKVPVILAMCEKLYPKNEQPDGGHVAGAIKSVGGAGRLADLLWQHSSRPPTGNPVQFVQGVAKGNRRKRTGPDGRELDVDGQPIRVWRDVHVEAEKEISDADR